MVSALLVSCETGSRVPSEADLSTFRHYVNALDTVRLEQSLKHILSSDTSQWLFDQAVKKRYADISKYEDTPLWYSRMGVIGEADSLLSYLASTPLCWQKHTSSVLSTISSWCRPMVVYPSI